MSRLLPTSNPFSSNLKCWTAAHDWTHFCQTPWVETQTTPCAQTNHVTLQVPENKEPLTTWCPNSECLQAVRVPLPLAPPLYTGHDLIWYGVSLWLVQVGHPGCNLPQVPVRINPVSADTALSSPYSIPFMSYSSLTLTKTFQLITTTFPIFIYIHT